MIVSLGDWRAVADIPNSEGFTVIVMSHEGEIAPAIVRRDSTSGCHYLEHAETGARISCRDIDAWEPR